ncbi:MAG TPA: autotransporter outer membrane beta-barrel domain-containing protein, partial [Sphingomicrobium sp.]|nr:autotransporter outer membrane beta-barrel domain-containing protein [Sphingomicrobium sp.]
VTIDGHGLTLEAVGATPHNNEVTNDGTAVGTVSGFSGLEIIGNGGTITYDGPGSALSPDYSRLGLSIFNSGTGDVSIGSTAPISGSYQGNIGIYAGRFGYINGTVCPAPATTCIPAAFSGTVSLDVAGASIAGGLAGILLDTDGAIGVVTDASTTISSFGHGIWTVGGGEVSIDNGARIAAANIGIQVDGAGTFRITNRGEIVAGNVGVFANPFRGALTLNNLSGGSISATTGATLTSTATAASVEVNNSGTITGFLDLNAAGPIAFNNLASGTFQAGGTSTFGGSDAVFNNAGMLSLAPAAGASDVVFDGLSQFTNSGAINLQNDRTGDQLTINGNYVGLAGSRLLADFATQTGTADRLVINGDASGSTGIYVNNLTPTAPFTTGAPIVQVNGTLAPNTFTLAGTQNFGALDIVLVTQNGSVDLAEAPPSDGATPPVVVLPQTVPNAVAASGLAALTAARTLAFQSNGVVLDRIAQLRTATQRGMNQPLAPVFSSLQPRAEYMADLPAGVQRPLAPAPVAVGTRTSVSTWARAFGDVEERRGR